MAPASDPSDGVTTASEIGFARGLWLPEFACVTVVDPFVERAAAGIADGTKRRADIALTEERSMSSSPLGLRDRVVLKRAIDCWRAYIGAPATEPSGTFDDRTAFESIPRR